jgi:hypothetical protein
MYDLFPWSRMTGVEQPSCFPLPFLHQNESNVEVRSCCFRGVKDTLKFSSWPFPLCSVVLFQIFVSPQMKGARAVVPLMSVICKHILVHTFIYTKLVYYTARKGFVAVEISGCNIRVALLDVIGKLNFLLRAIYFMRLKEICLSISHANFF